MIYTSSRCYFNKIIYWKLEKAHNVSIPKNDIFLNNIIPRLQTIWNTITYYREHQDKLTQLKNITKQKAKYYKVNIEFNIHNNFIINNKILFLDKKFNRTDFLIKYNTNESILSTIECDFIDE